MFKKILTRVGIISPENHMMGFQIKSGKVHEIFTGIIPMLADATDVVATGADAPGCLLNKRIYTFNAFLYFLGNTFDFVQFIPMNGECLLQRMHYLIIREWIPAGILFQCIIRFHVHRETFPGKILIYIISRATVKDIF